MDRTYMIFCVDIDKITKITKTYLLKQSVDTDASLRLARSLSWAEVGL